MCVYYVKTEVATRNWQTSMLDDRSQQIVMHFESESQVFQTVKDFQVGTVWKATARVKAMKTKKLRRQQQCSLWNRNEDP